MAAKSEPRHLSSSILAKAKFALRLATKEPENLETCSDDYWKRVIEHLAKLHDIERELVEEALKREDLYK